MNIIIQLLIIMVYINQYVQIDIGFLAINTIFKY